MTAADVVSVLKHAGHTLELDGERLRIRPKPPADLRDEIRLRKPAIVAYLREGVPATAHRYVLWRGCVDRGRSVCLSCGVPPLLHGEIDIAGRRSTHGMMCKGCRKLDIVRLADRLCDACVSQKVRRRDEP